MKQMSELTAELQTHCNEGDSHSEVLIKVLDGIYKVGRLIPYNTPSGKRFYVIEAVCD